MKSGAVAFRRSLLAGVVFTTLITCFTCGIAQAENGFTYTCLANFNGVGAYNSYGTLALDPAGNIYGVTYDCDWAGNYIDSGCGGVFKISAGTHQLTTITKFNGQGPGYTYCGMNADSVGHIYGLSTWCHNAYGAILSVNGNSVDTIATFSGTPGPASPYNTSMTSDAAGNLYGTTCNGGLYNKGCVFKMDAVSHQVSVVASFDGSGSNGLNPYGGVVLDAAGNIYGTAHNGGANGYGTLYEIPAGSSTMVKLVDFDGSNGKYPWSGLTFDAAGNLYGTTESDNINFYWGSIFKISAGTHTLTTVAKFDVANGADPQGTLVYGPDGSFYGTTLSGGNNNLGTVYKFDPRTNAITRIYAFTGGADGQSPWAGLAIDAAGNLYGTTTSNYVQEGFGTVFMLSPTPEPATLALLVVGSLAMLRRRK